MKKRFIFLSNAFYVDYPTADYPEIEQKRNRPYIQIYIEIDGVSYAIPLRSDIKHPYVLWTDKENHCGLDFSKAVVVKDEYISDIIPFLREKEFNSLRGKDAIIYKKMKQYIQKYKDAKANPEKGKNYLILKYSTLQYFEKEIGLN